MKKITVGSLLRDGKTLNLLDLPYGYQIIMTAPEDVVFDLTKTANENYHLLKGQGKEEFLNTKVETILVEQESRKIKQMLRWSFVTGTLGSFGTLIAVVYIAIMQNEMPDTWLVGFLVGVPAMIMWAQAGILKSENAASLGKIISALPTKTANKIFGREEELPKSQDNPHQNNSNGNPFR